jgi:ASC-1-like (ASCH) protein
MNEIDIESTMVEAIRNGDKTIEVRLAKPQFLLIQENDILSVREDFYYEGDVLESLSDALKVKVIQILYFESFKELFDAINFEAVLPSAKTDEEAIATFRKLYSAEDEAAFGVAAFTIEPILA